MLTNIRTIDTKFSLAYTPAKRGTKDYLYELFFLFALGFWIGLVLLW